jgi:hypothetical protein
VAAACSIAAAASAVAVMSCPLLFYKILETDPIPCVGSVVKADAGIAWTPGKGSWNPWLLLPMAWVS